MMERKQLIDIMYISKSGEITKRTVKVTKVEESTFTAYCFGKRASRTFLLSNVLSFLPVKGK